MFYIIAGLIILVVLYQIRYYTVKAKERKAYENMIITPNDSSVSQYIKAFLTSHTHTKLAVGDGVHMTNDEKKNMEDKLRQAQGYQIIVQSPNVSDQVKEQLRKAFVTKGVPIQ